MQPIPRLAAAALALALLYLPTATSGAGPENGTVEYVVDHETLGDVGRHKYTFRRDGEDLIVDTEVRLAAKVLFIVVRRYEADRHEVWRQGRLVAYDSRTNDDGKEIVVRIRANGDKYVVEGPDGRFEAPGEAHLATAWNKDVVRRPLLLDVETGKLMRVSTRDAGVESVELGDRQVKARKYVMTGDLEREFWFDSNDHWVRLRMDRNGDKVDIRLYEAPAELSDD